MNKSECRVEVFSRVTGFFRPVQSWNKGKTEEFKNRKTFCINFNDAEKSNESSRATEIISG